MVPIIQSFAQLQKNYGKEGSEIIVDNCQDILFGGFAPNSESAEVLSKALGNSTVLSGSVSKGKNDPSKSLQMIQRPLMTPDELKSLPKGHFILAKTGCHPMRTARTWNRRSCAGRGKEMRRILGSLLGLWNWLKMTVLTGSGWKDRGRARLVHKIISPGTNRRCGRIKNLVKKAEGKSQPNLQEPSTGFKKDYSGTLDEGGNVWDILKAFTRRSCLTGRWRFTCICMAGRIKREAVGLPLALWPGAEDVPQYRKEGAGQPGGCRVPEKRVQVPGERQLYVEPVYHCLTAK